MNTYVKSTQTSYLDTKTINSIFGQVEIAYYPPSKILDLESDQSWDLDAEPVFKDVDSYYAATCKTQNVLFEGRASGRQGALIDLYKRIADHLASADINNNDIN